MSKFWIVSAALAWALSASQPGLAALQTFYFSIDGFENGGSVFGSFSGEDRDGDGYLSSFIFSQDIDMDGTGFENGFADNEVYAASARFTGLFDDDNNAATAPVDVDFELSNDLTSIDDLFFGLFPTDLFFVLNYKLDGGPLGDDPFEGMLIGQADSPAILGLGRFLPFPDAPGQPVFDSINDLPGGSTLTSQLINNNSLGAPCQQGATCGVVHTVLPNITVGGKELTNSLATVDAPATPLLLLGGLVALIRRRAKPVA